MIGARRTDYAMVHRPRTMRCRTAERLSAEGRSKRRKIGARGYRGPAQTVYAGGDGRAQSRVPARDIREHHASSSAVVLNRSARVVSSLARSGFAAS